MNFLKACNAPIYVQLDGESIALYPLTLAQCGAIMAKRLETERAFLIDTLKSAGAKPEDIVSQVRDLEWRAGRISYGVDYGTSLAGIMDTLHEASGGKIGRDVAIAPGQMIDIAQKLWGVDTSVPKYQAAAEQPKGASATG